MQRGVATFTLDWGKCPPWLFQKMVKLGREMIQVLVAEYGPDEFIRRIADPVWFQSLGTVLAFDWNASGLTTTLTAALKEAIRDQERDLGIFICGGKGKTSRKTPDQILDWGERLNMPEEHALKLVYNSRMSAKVDSALVQDNFQIYHHTFFFSLRRGSKQAQNGAWAVVQQGMNTENQTARRYHWFSEDINDLIVEPHSGIISDSIDRKNNTLNLTAKRSTKNRELSVGLIQDGYKTIMNDIELLRRHSSDLSAMASLQKGKDKLTLLQLANEEFHEHPVEYEDFSKSRYLERILGKLCDTKPENYEKILATEGVGPKTIRALALVSEVIYGADPSYEDPARYSFAHGGKDGTPFLVDRITYDKTIEAMQEVVKKTGLSAYEKDKVLKRLKKNN